MAAQSPLYLLGAQERVQSIRFLYFRLVLACASRVSPARAESRGDPRRPCHALRFAWTIKIGAIFLSASSSRGSKQAIGPRLSASAVGAM
jgi:hypothetical protein